MAIGRGLIEKDDAWMEMILSRQKTSHTYNEELADEITDRIISKVLFFI